MTCCSYPWPHSHYAEWIRETVIRVVCRPRLADGSPGPPCGKHVRTMLVNDLLLAFAAGR